MVHIAESTTQSAKAYKEGTIFIREEERYIEPSNKLINIKIAPN